MADKIAKRGISLYIDGNKVINSVKDIRGEMQKLINEQAKMTIGSDDYVRHAQKIAQLQTILDEHKRKQKEVTAEYAKMSGAAEDFERKNKKAFSFSSLADGFNKYFGMITAFIASLTGLTLGARKAVDQFAELEETEADVRKYTGMTKAEVKDLGEEFKKFDTRTARTELNALAADAGRLGKKSKQDLIDFAEGGNIIRVALGEDLGKDAIKDIGKLSMMFGNAEKMGLKNAMLATGSAINEVAQNSSAAEPYLVDFSNRLAGVGNQAGMTISQIIGLGSVLDQNAQQVEMSGTALSGLIMKLYKNPAKFAKIAGLEVKSFTKLLREDANGALLELLDTLSKKGGMADLAPIFEEMKLDGARASSVLSVLAGNIDQIRKEQATATQAFEQGTSVINEYNVKNNTLQANIDKAKKKFQELVYELGEKLSPHMSSFISTGGMMVKILSTMTSLAFKHSGAIITITSAIIAYGVAIKAQTLYQKTAIAVETIAKLTTLANAGAKAIATGNTVRATAAMKLYYSTLSQGSAITKTYIAVTALLSAGKALLTGNIARATVAMRTFFTVVKTNPIGFVVGLFVAAAGAIYAYYQKTKSATEELQRFSVTQKQINEETKKYTEEISREKTALNSLILAIVNTNKDSELRKALISQLKKEYPDYIKYINAEKASNEQLLVILKEVNKSYAERYKIAAYKGKSDAVGKTVEDATSRQIEITEQLKGLYSETMTADKIKQIKDLEDEYSRLGNVIVDGIKKVSEYDAEAAKIQKNLNKQNTYEGVSELLSQKVTEIERLKKTIVGKADDALTVSIKENIKTLEVEADLLAQKLDKMFDEKLSGDNSDSPTPTPSPGNNDKASAQKKRSDDELTKLEEKHLDELTAIKKKYLSGEIKTEYEFNQAILDQQDKFDNDRKEKIQEQLDTYVKDASLKADLSKKKAEIENKMTDRQIQQSNKVKKILLDSDLERKEKEEYENRLRELSLFNTGERKLTEDEKKVLELLEQQHQENLERIRREGNKPENRKANTELKRLDEEQAKDQLRLAESHKQGITDERKYKYYLLSIELAYLEEKKKINGLTDDQILQLNKQSLEKQQELLEILPKKKKKKGEKEPTLEASKNADIAFLEAQYALGEASEEAYRIRLLAINDYYDALEIERNEKKVQTIMESAKFGLEIMQDMLGGYSSYVQACQDAESAKINKKYDAEIKAAGNNERKKKKIEEKRDAELKKMQAEHENKSYKIQIAQALASTAMAAINAYASAVKVNFLLGPIAAAAAVTAGMMNVATIKKQHEAAMTNYWDGGFTPSGTWNKPVGIVHPDEFVANRFSTANSTLRPVFDVIDYAQRNNTVSSLKKEDIAKALRIQGYSSGGYTPQVQKYEVSRTDNNNNATYERFILLMERLEKKMDEPFIGEVSLLGRNGIKEKMDLYNKIKSNTTRNG